MNSISNAFQKEKVKGNGVLIGYIMAGDPNVELTPKIADALIEGGVDILELGLPFSDPIADGPTIQEASVRALTAGTTPIKVLELVKEIKFKHNVPIIIMTYYNPVFRIGLQKFLGLAKDYMVNGFIIPDLPIEEAGEYMKVAKTCGLDTIFLVAPSTSNERLNKIVGCSKGFLYLVSHFGVTGAKTKVEGSTVQLIKRILPFTKGKIPLSVGFGLSKPEHIQSIIASGASAAIVGSAFINIIQSNKDIPEMLKQLQLSAKRLKAATKIAVQPETQ